jgi:glucose/arabinose dehydrogenase
MKKYAYSLFLLFLIFQHIVQAQSLIRTSFSLEQLTLPPGFKIEMYADQIPGARTMAISDAGVVFVGTRGQGKVYALIPPKNPQEKMRTVTLLSGLNEPNGVAYYQGDLYVAEIHRILKYPNVDKHLDNMPAPIVVNESLPSEKHHGYRVIHVGPDNYLYIAIGMPCNTCDYRNKQPLFGTISRMSLDGKTLAPYAIGIRNSVGFDFHPETKELWFTDNGQDLLGDDIPPDEINRADKAGLDFGFPYVYGDNTLAPGYKAEDIKGLSFEKPTYKLQAHVAPLGLIFYTGKQFPSEYHNQMFVAFHGSWNRSKKVGYEVVMLTLEGNRVTKMQPFVTGFLEGQMGWGRPVDFLMLPDGSLLITDDFNGSIYRVYWQQNN